MMCTIKILISFVLLISTQSVEEAVIPADNFVAEWKKSRSMRRFIEKDLFNYINGAAELFHEFGFEELWVQRYKKEEKEITLEIYRMESPEAALGIYLMKCGDETPAEGISVRNSGSRFQLIVVKGSYFVQVNNPDGNETFLPVMVVLIRHLLESIPEERPVTLFGFLPKENLVSGSELIIRGPYALQPIFTFGEGDILRLGGKIFGVVGDYKDCYGDVFTRLIILYPDEEATLSAYRNLFSNLDPYLQLHTQWERGFVFKDYRNKFGVVEIKEHGIEIRINLLEKPVQGIDKN